MPERSPPTRSLGVIVAAALLSTPTFAQAHAGGALTGGFVSGLLHPVLGWDHLLAMVAVGLWGAFLGRPLIYLLPIMFPGLMTFGACLAMLGAPAPPVELGIALSVLILGGAIAMALRAPVWAACLVVGVFGVCHGYAHGLELPTAADPVAYSAGFVLATGGLHVAGVAIGSLASRPWGKLLTRTAGGLIALTGAYFVYMAAAA